MQNFIPTKKVLLQALAGRSVALGLNKTFDILKRIEVSIRSNYEAKSTSFEKNLQNLESKVKI